jgi:hypothetical protein
MHSQTAQAIRTNQFARRVPVHTILFRGTVRLGPGEEPRSAALIERLWPAAEAGN